MAVKDIEKSFEETAAELLHLAGEPYTKIAKQAVQYAEGLAAKAADIPGEDDLVRQLRQIGRGDLADGHLANRQELRSQLMGDANSFMRKAIEVLGLAGPATQEVGKALRGEKPAGKGN